MSTAAEVAVNAPGSSAIRRPVIALTSYVEPAHWGSWNNVSACLVPYSYVAAITNAGARVVILPPDHLDADVLSRVDGLVLAGGADIGPSNYGQDPHPTTDSPRTDRDAAELLLAQAAMDADLPTLGVCRGLQILAVASGGTLHQHLPDVVGNELHRPQLGAYVEQSASFVPGSLAASILGIEVEVNSSHHQAVDDPGSLTISGWAPDGTIESLEDRAKKFLLGVQWHPEVTSDQRVFAALVAAARR